MAYKIFPNLTIKNCKIKYNQDEYYLSFKYGDSEFFMHEEKRLPFTDKEGKYVKKAHELSNLDIQFELEKESMGVRVLKDSLKYINSNSPQFIFYKEKMTNSG